MLSSRFALTASLALALAAAGCSQLSTLGEPSPQERAAHKAETIEPMLSAAGFTMLPATTPEREQEMANLTPLEISYYVGKTGRLHYWMADPEFCHCIYYGSDESYQRYEQMRLQEKWTARENEAARENLEAQQEEEMNMQMEMFNPYGFGFVGPGIYF
jgi:hypothetical protein